MSCLAVIGLFVSTPAFSRESGFACTLKNALIGLVSGSKDKPKETVSYAKLTDDVAWKIVHTPGSLEITMNQENWPPGGFAGKSYVRALEPDVLIKTIGARRAKLAGIEEISKSDKGTKYRFPDRDGLNGLAEDFNSKLPSASPDRMLVKFYDAPQALPDRETINRFIDNFEWPYSNEGALAVHDGSLHSLVNFTSNRLLNHTSRNLKEVMKFVAFMESHPSDIVHSKGWTMIIEKAALYLDGVLATTLTVEGSLHINEFDLTSSPEKLIETLVTEVSVGRGRKGLADKEALEKAYRLYRTIRRKQGDPVPTQPLKLTSEELKQDMDRKFQLLESQR